MYAHCTNILFSQTCTTHIDYTNKHKNTENTIHSFFFTGTNGTIDEDTYKKHPELWGDIQGKLK